MAWQVRGSIPEPVNVALFTPKTKFHEVLTPLVQVPESNIMVAVAVRPVKSIEVVLIEATVFCISLNKVSTKCTMASLVLTNGFAVILALVHEEAKLAEELSNICRKFTFRVFVKAPRTMPLLGF